MKETNLDLGVLAWVQGPGNSGLGHGPVHDGDGAVPIRVGKRDMCPIEICLS